MKDPDTMALLELASESARAAGAVLKDSAHQLRNVTFSDSRDVKLAADTEAEKIVRAKLAASGLPVYGEELGGDVSVIESGELIWLVDPLDGTFNYLREIPTSAVSIGLLRGIEPVLGVIYDFNTDTLFAGTPHGSMTINGEEQPKPAWADNLDEAALITGFPAGMEKDAASLAAFTTRILPFKKVRMIGSAAMALAMVARGQCDAYFEPSIRLWDVAAGISLVRASGGVVEMRPSANRKTLAYDVWAAGRAGFIQRS